MPKRTEQPRPEYQRLPTGIAGLDALIEGGFVRGGLYVVAGSLGAGKTILAHQVAFNLIANGGRVLYLTVFAESHTRLLNHIKRFTFFAPDALGDQFSYISGYQTQRDQGPKGLLQLIQPMLREHKITLLIVDGLPLATPRQSYDTAVDDFLHDLQTYTEIMQCTTLVLTPAYPDMWESHALLFVDGAIELRTNGTGVQPRRQIEVKKFLATAYHHGVYSFEITQAGLVLGDKVK